MPRFSLLAALLFSLSAPVAAQPASLTRVAEPTDSAAIAFIKAEAGERGQVMRTALWLTDVHGPRLTGSPQLDAAERWAAAEFRRWGLTAQIEPWGTFGRGWTVERFMLNARVDGPVVARQTFPVVAVPRAWSPGTGRVTAEMVHFNPATDDEMAAFRGRLGGKIVLLSDEADVNVGFEPLASRRTDEALLELANAGSPDVATRSYSPEAIQRALFTQRKIAFLVGESPAAILQAGDMGGAGSIRTTAASVPSPEGASYTERRNPWEPGVETVAQFVVLSEHYNRLLRLMEAGQRVTLELDFEARFHDESPEENNVIAEIAGSDLSAEVVMVGAHLDSWHGGSGATDNAAGSSVVMEAARVLQAYYASTGTRPRRTIRFALWTGEEQGLYGSTGYVNRHFAAVEGYGRPPTALRPDHARLSAYYNLDNGTGRIRGVYLQSNDAVRPIFRSWLAAFADTTAQTLTLGNTGGTDHVSFDAAGLPGFQFIQDHAAYFTQTWHGSMDTYDHLVEADLEQASAVMAVFAHHTATRDALMPRKPLVLAPTGTN